MDTRVRIEGLRDLRAGLKAIDDQLPKELRKVHRDVAKIIGEAARAKGKSLGGVHARMAGGIRWSATQTKGYLRLGNSKKYPSVLGAEFGAAHDRPRTVRTPRTGSGSTRTSAYESVVGSSLQQRRTYTKRGWNFLPTRNPDGYMVYPTIREKGDEMVDEYAQRLDPLWRQAFPNG